MAPSLTNDQAISKDYLQAWNILARTIHHASECTFKSRKSVLIIAFFNDIYWFLITKISEMHDELLKRVCIFAWLPQCIGNKVRELWCGIKLDIVLHANGQYILLFCTLQVSICEKLHVHVILSCAYW